MLTGMEINIPYEEGKDRTFYKCPNSTTHVDVGNGFFAIMFPDDAHGPQHYIDKPEADKKSDVKSEIILRYANTGIKSNFIYETLLR